jgi:hypothetical protein
MATYVNDLRLKEISTGDESGTWGTSTNTNLELIGEALGYATQEVFGSDADATTTIADGASDPARAMYFKITSAGSLTATRTCTIAPNTVSRVMFIENATTGSQSIAISQGSGASVTIATGKTAVVYLDGAGATAAVVDAMSGVDPGVTDTLAEVLVAGNTTGGTDLAVSTGDDITFADSSKAIFGAGSDLQIYHDGADSYIKEDGTGNLIIAADDFRVTNVAVSEVMIAADTDGSVSLYHNGSAKLATTATGIDVTGTVTADGLTVEGSSTVDAITYTASSSFPTTGVSLNSNGFSYEMAGTQGKIFRSASNTKALMQISNDGDISFYEDTGTTPKFFWDASAESLGIGTISPASPLSVYNASNPYANFADAANYLNVGVITSTYGLINSSLPISFQVSDVERLRIDASGNLLVGKTSTAFGTEGFVYEAGAAVEVTTDSNRVMRLNRTTSDGNIIELNKDGTTAGSIGVEGGDLTIGNADTGLQFVNTSQIIRPQNLTTNSAIDAQVSLGQSAYRFKDLYLSGGVYLGGTGAANKLEDYETGTWTPVLSKSGTAPSVTYTEQVGTYTKVGRMIYVSGLLSWTAISGGTGDFRITNLPFTILSSVGAYPQMVSTDYGGVTFGANDTTFGGFGAPNATYIVLVASKNNATNATAISGLAGSGFMYFNLTYQVA